MSFFSFAGVSLGLLVITMFFMFYIMAALSRFSAQIVEFRVYRQTQTDNVDDLYLSVRNLVTAYDTKLESVLTRFGQVDSALEQFALQFKAIRQDHSKLLLDLDAHFGTVPKQVNELIEHFKTFQEGLSQFSEGLQKDNEQVLSAVRQVQQTLDLIRNDTQ